MYLHPTQDELCVLVYGRYNYADARPITWRLSAHRPIGRELWVCCVGPPPSRIRDPLLLFFSLQGFFSFVTPIDPLSFLWWPQHDEGEWRRALLSIIIIFIIFDAGWSYIWRWSSILVSLHLFLNYLLASLAFFSLSFLLLVVFSSLLRFQWASCDCFFFIAVPMGVARPLLAVVCCSWQYCLRSDGDDWRILMIILCWRVIGRCQSVESVGGSDAVLMRVSELNLVSLNIWRIVHPCIVVVLLLMWV
jgi:hypothetical protein